MSRPSLPVHRLEIGIRPGQRDPRGEDVARAVRSFLGLAPRRIRTRDVYRIYADLSAEERERVRGELTDPVVQRAAYDRLEDGPADSVIEIGYKPGVTDPVGKSARVAIEDCLERPLPAEAAVYTATLYLLEGLSVAETERVATGLLANAVVQEIQVRPFAEWSARPPDLHVPRITTERRAPVEVVSLAGDDAALLELSRRRLLALNLEEMQAIREHFRQAAGTPERRAAGLGADPTDVELEMLAQTWSEHCKHKIFNALVRYEEPGRPPETLRSLFKTHIRGATEEVEARRKAQGLPSFLVSVFHDNAGVVAFDAQDHLVYKVETHNSPSALDPYGGAITGIVGVNRDPFGTGIGAELLANVWGYCFASPFYAGDLPKGLLHPRRVRNGVHQGVIDGGNQSGVPYARGWELFDQRFLGKPLVFCGTVGKLPVQVAGRPGEEKGARPGDQVVMVGGRIGADGIHGATFSSAALDESAPIQAVQIGDPITQKRMFDFLLEARDLGLYSAITDNGAGGLSSSIGEMAQGPGGAELDLAKAPLKYQGLAPWEILLSEAQERMSLAVPPERMEAFLALARRREVEATVLGRFTASGYFVARFGEQVVAQIALRFLHDGAPELELPARWTPPRFPEPPARPRPSLSEQLQALVGRLNLASHEDKARTYDHEVKGLTVVKPFVGAAQDVLAEATVWMVRHGSTRGYVLSEGVNPFYSDLDTHAMARAVVDLAVRRVLAGGGSLERVALLDNFCWPDPVESKSTPDGAYKMAQLVRACRGLHEAVVAYGAPLISGKDSMKNDSTMGGVRISVPPTLLVSAIAQIPDVRQAVTLDPKLAGEHVFLLGRTADERGGSEHHRYLGELDQVPVAPGAPAPYLGGQVPALDTAATVPLYRALEVAMRSGWVRAAAVPAMGGLAVAFARMAMAGRLGLDLDLAPADLAALAPEAALFSESTGRLVVTVAPEHVQDFTRALAGQPCAAIGRVVPGERLVVRCGGEPWIDVAISALVRAHKETLSHA